jgi:hypothetical protein
MTMPSNLATRGAALVALGALCWGVQVPTATAQDAVYPGCAGFDVGVTTTSSRGNPSSAGPRAVLLAGTSSHTLTNESTGATVGIRTAGSVFATAGAGGSAIVTVNGPSVLILFPTDPGGPSTTLYSGRVVFEQSATGVTTLISSTGATRDLCAALGG